MYYVAGTDVTGTVVVKQSCTSNGVVYVYSVYKPTYCP